MQRYVLLVCLLALAVAGCDDSAQSNSSLCADQTPSPLPTSTDFTWVDIGDPGNANDPPVEDNGDPLPTSGPSAFYPTGGVDYAFRMSKYETTNYQYAEFLNAVAKTDPHGLYKPSNPYPSITQSGTDGSYVYDVVSGDEHRPVQKISFLQAIRFVNWLDNLKPTAVSGSYTPLLSVCPQEVKHPLSPTGAGAIAFNLKDRFKEAGLTGCRSGTYYDTPTTTSGAGVGALIETSFTYAVGISTLVKLRITDPGTGYLPGDTLTIGAGTICNVSFPTSINTAATVTLSTDPGPYDDAVYVPEDFRTAEDTTTEDGSAPICLYFVKDRNQSDAGVRNDDATYLLPTAHEWYKAAYYDGASATYKRYPAGSDTVPVCACPGSDPNTANCDSVVGKTTEVGSYTASVSPYGTVDQGGNLFEWVDRKGDYIECPERIYKGGSFNLIHRPNISYLNSPFFYQECSGTALDTTGLRVAHCPAPPCSFYPWTAR